MRSLGAKGIMITTEQTKVFLKYDGDMDSFIKLGSEKENDNIRKTIRINPRYYKNEKWSIGK